MIITRRDCLKIGAATLLPIQERPRLRAGVLGTRHAHASGKFVTLRKLSAEWEVVGVAEPDPARRAAAEKDPAWRGARWMSEEDLLASPGLQVVAVETAVRDLVPAAKRCVAAGMHVHLDKPPGAAMAEFRALLEEAEKRKRVVQLGYMLRYNPALQFVFKAARDGRLGRIFEINATMGKFSNAGARKEMAEFSGGAMFELGCHLIDSAVTILGKPVKVTPVLQRTRPEQDALADNTLAVLEYERASVTIRVSLVEVAGERRRQFIVCGDKGTAEIRPLEPPRLVFAGAETALTPSGGRYDGEFLDLAKIVRGEKAPDWDAAHDLAVHETVLRASGMPVE